MNCPKCGSSAVSVQMVTETKEKRKKGLFYWIFIGWWWEIFAWLFLTLPKLFVALFGRKTKTVSKTTKVAVCQSCGYNWTIK